MKKILSLASLILVLAIACAVFVGCQQPVEEQTPASLWDNATYTADKTFGSGAKCLTVVVEAEDRSVTLTVMTDKSNVADALVEHSLISGEESELYGLTVYAVNGMTADFNVDSAYWAFYVNGEYALTGASFIEVNNGDTVKIAYEKF